MRRSFLPILVLTGGLSLHAGVISGSVSCSNRFGPGILSSSPFLGCQDPIAGVEAYWEVEILPPAYANPEPTGHVLLLSGYAYRWRSNGAEAFSEADIRLPLLTEGPVRPGWIDLNMSVRAMFFAKATAVVGSHEIHVGPGPGSHADTLQGRFPILLGQAFVADVSGYARVPLVMESSSFSTSASFQVTEFDGTPVRVYVTPEPATFALTGGMLLCLGLLRMRHVA